MISLAVGINNNDKIPYLNFQIGNCTKELKFCIQTKVDSRQPLIEDNFQWKMTFDGRLPMMEDDLQWKTTFDGRQPTMLDEPRWKTAIDGKQPLM